MVKHTQTIRQQQSTNCLSVFDLFVGLALRGLKQLYPTASINLNLLSMSDKAKLFDKL